MRYTLVNIWELSDHTIFDGIVLPDGIKKDVLINSIFDECEEYEPITANPDLYRAKIANFFAKNYDNFNRLYKLTLAEYDPIENYDKKSDIVTDESNENKVSAYDSDVYEPNTSYGANTHMVERTHGNIGVTTTAQMITGERELWQKFNIYQLIATQFMFALTVPVE